MWSGDNRLAQWHVGAYASDLTGRFSHCAASAKDRNGIYLTYSFTTNSNWHMGLASKKWRLTPGDEYSIKYRVDDGRPDSVIAKAADNQTTRFKDNADLFNAFRRGRTLHVRVQSTDLAFNITNTSLILDFLQKCVASGGNFDEVADKPSPSPPAT